VHTQFWKVRGIVFYLKTKLYSEKLSYHGNIIAHFQWCYSPPVPPPHTKCQIWNILYENLIRSQNTISKKESSNTLNTAHGSTVQHTTARHGTAQHRKVRHSTAQHGTAPHSTEKYGTAQHGTARHGTAWHGTAWHSTAQHGTARHGTAQHSTAQHDTTRHSTAQHSTAQHIPHRCKEWSRYDAVI
jgi:hypothetical protein